MDKDWAGDDSLDDMEILARISQTTPGSKDSQSRLPRNVPGPSILFITILAAGTDLATSDITGQVKHGFIRLSGSLIPARVEPSPNSHLDVSDVSLDMPIFHDQEHYVGLDLDPKTKYGQVGIFFMPILLNQESSLQGLIVELVDPINNIYERIGIARAFDINCTIGWDWRDEFKEQVLTLI